MKSKILLILMIVVGGMAFSQIGFFNQGGGDDSDNGSNYNILEFTCKMAGMGCPE